MWRLLSYWILLLPYINCILTMSICIFCIIFCVARTIGFKTISFIMNEEALLGYAMWNKFLQQKIAFSFWIPYATIYQKIKIAYATIFQKVKIPYATKVFGYAMVKEISKTKRLSMSPNIPSFPRFLLYTFLI